MGVKRGEAGKQMNPQATLRRGHRVSPISLRAVVMTTSDPEV